MRPKRRLRKTRSGLLLALIPGVLGVLLIHWAPSATLEKAGGLDNLFLLRGTRTPPPEVCVVAIDDDSYTEIGRDQALPWPRAKHAELLRTLKAEGARAVAFDVIFEDPSADPDADEALRSALADTKFGVLGVEVSTTEDPQFRQVQVHEPYEPFKEAAAAIADVGLPTDSDGVLRYAWTAREGRPGLALAAYELATGDPSQRSDNGRVLDYYGPARSIKTVSIYQALDPKQYLPPGFFKDKIVFVGTSRDADLAGASKDSFLTPYRGAHGSMTFGVEIHATLAANLLEHRQIRLLDSRAETALLLLLPLLSTLVFMYLRPLAAGGAFVAMLLAPWVMGYVAFSRYELWVPIVIPSAIQLPISYGLSLIWYYLTTVREREKIKRAFGLYLSPEMIKRIAEDPDAVDLGGQEIVGTAMFTDIKGFTPLAEGKGAHEVAAMLNAYFSEATTHVFDAGGTLIKYIGDAVFAIWGAPIPREDHATQACIAALALARAQKSEGVVAQLVTRIGVHTGPMLVGNLGSAQRFDYTAIGDAVNLASRIEGLNKAFGTLALASGEALRATDGRFITRPLGRVKVVGRTEPVELHELVGTKDEPPANGHLGAFAAALEDFRAGRFAQAEAGFSAIDGDYASKFFAAYAGRLAANPPEAWDGVVVIESK
ncbi:MAG TPA: adenylate/guanylate cyclase domain-containing protein [Candidatus Polarisedimenticolaceae bacterium]|nr:adenylate/guanylate cyclase domain-containing protein [Candidatus Polarisedimenticolaceae bacterium]